MNELIELESFPNDFCIKNSLDEIKKNQEKLIKKVRADIYKKYKKGIEKSNKKITFKFYDDKENDNLWYENRKKIVREILERFLTFNVKSIKNKNDFDEKIMSVDNVSINDIKNGNELPDVIDIIEIEIWKQ